MDHWETTLAGVLGAVGITMQQAGGVPHWFNVLGSILQVAGSAWLGYSAASSRGVKRQIDSQPDTTTLTIKETKSSVQQDEKSSPP